MKSVTIPEKKDNIDGYKIGDCAFCNCNNLVNVPIPESVTSIGNYAFSKCYNLGTIVLPASLVTLSSSAFSDSSVDTMYIKSEDSPIALTLVDNEINYIAEESGIKDATDRFLNREKTLYYPVLSTVSSSGLVTLAVEYRFKKSVESKVSNLRLKIRIPSTVDIAKDTVKVDGVITAYSVSGNYLYVTLQSSSGVVTFSVKPKSSKYLISYAQIEYRLNGNSKAETIGILNMATKLLTINVPEETSMKTIAVSGITEPDKEVSILVDKEIVATCQASKVGTFSKRITLPNTVEGKVYEVTAQVADEDENIKTVSDYVTYTTEALVMTNCKMYYASTEYDLMNIDGKSPIITWTGGKFTFNVSFEKNDNIKDLYIVSDKNGEIRSIKAEYDKSKNTFVATGFENYIPGKFSIKYTAQNKEYIIDVISDIDVNAEYEALPEGLKNANVNIDENTIDGSGYGKIAATIDFGLGEDATIEYSAETVRVDNSTISEQQLQNQGFVKIKKNDGTYSYVNFEFFDSSPSLMKAKAAGASSYLGSRTRMTAYNYDRRGNLIERTNIDTINGLADDIIRDQFLPEGYSTIAGLIPDIIDIGKETYDRNDLRNKIQKLNISDSEKKERMEKLDNIYLRSVTMRELSMSTQMLSAIIGLAGGPIAGLVAGCVSGWIFNYMKNVLDDEFDDVTNDLLDTDLLNCQFRYKVDPSGYVYEAVPSNRISDVKTTIYYKDEKTGKTILWDASEYDQNNPLLTDDNGGYSWDVPEGQWQVKYEKTGYETTYSEWMPVPPPQLDVNIGIVSTAAPTVEFINIYQDEAEVKFSQYMDIDSITSSNVTFTCGGKTVTGSFEVMDAEKNYDGSKEYATTFSFLPDSNFSDNVTVNINGVKNYADKAIASAYNETKTVVLRVQTLDVADEMSIGYNSNGTIILQATPASAAAGKKVNISLGNSYVAELDSTEVTLDSKGKANVNVKTLLPGDVDITFEVVGTLVKETMKLSVVLSVTPSGHVHSLVYHEGKSPTCTEVGWKPYQTCESCTYSTYVELSATGHVDADNDGECDNCGIDLTEGCSCACHKKGIANFFFKILLFFQKIFRKNKVCNCGVYHY